MKYVTFTHACAISSTVRSPYPTHTFGSGFARLAAVLSCHAVTFISVPLGSNGAAASVYWYVLCQLKLKSPTWLKTSRRPVGKIASMAMALPRRCICGWKLSIRAARFSGKNPSVTAMVFGSMSKLPPPVAPIRCSTCLFFGSSPFG